MALATVVCRGPCKRVVWEGGELVDGQVVLPFDDGQVLLTQFALQEPCPAGGTAAGCPNTPQAIEEQAEQRPARLRQLVKAIRDRAPRTVRLSVPALAANTPLEIPVTWNPPVPDNSYNVSIAQEFAAPVLLGAIRVAVKAGTRTTTGCVLLVASTRDVADNQAGLHVAALP